MKDFMMIFIGADYESMGLSPEQMQERMGRWFSWHQKMSEQGIIKNGDALKSPVTRLSGPDRTRTDVAGAEIKELVGGYYTFQAKDLDAAVAVASDYPDFDLGGTVEVREVMVFE